MTIQHAIVAFPAFEALEHIEAVRQDFDPQAALLPAHITLVFPFISNGDTAALCEHINDAVASCSPFEITVEPPSAEDGGYLFLRVTRGREQIVELHDRLYRGPLRPHLSPAHPFVPHVTVGRLQSPEALASACAAANSRLAAPTHGRLTSVSLFRIEDGMGTVVLTTPLSGAPADSARAGSRTDMTPT